MKILALSGFKRSGKDTVANHLEEIHGFIRVSFADPLKDMVSDLFKIPRYYLDDPEFKEKPLREYPVPATDGFTKMLSNFMVREFKTASNFPADVTSLKEVNGVLQTFTDIWENLYHTPRSLAILIGSSMRSATADFWTQKAIESIKDIHKYSGNENFVISDLRYQSEIFQLEEEFSDEVITVRINRFDSSLSTDPSERDLDNYKFNVTLENKATKDDLLRLADQLVLNKKGT